MYVYIYTHMRYPYILRSLYIIYIYILCLWNIPHGGKSMFHRGKQDMDSRCGYWYYPHEPREILRKKKHIVGDWKHIWLVVLTILKNISQWEGLSHILLNIKNVWNHQPGWDDYSQYMKKKCSKPPTRSPSYSHCCWFIAYENHTINHHY